MELARLQARGEAVERADLNFELAAMPVPALCLDEVASKKRAEARRRHALLEDAVAAMVRATRSPAGAPWAGGAWDCALAA